MEYTSDTWENFFRIKSYVSKKREVADKPCVVCENVWVSADIWEEEMGMCLDCSNDYWSEND